MIGCINQSECADTISSNKSSASNNIKNKELISNKQEISTALQATTILSISTTNLARIKSTKTTDSFQQRQESKTLQTIQ